MSSPKGDSSTSSFLICMPFISFSFTLCILHCVYPSTILNETGESVHAHFVIDLRRKAFTLAQLRIMLIVGFLWMFFIKLRKSLSNPIFF